MSELNDQSLREMDSWLTRLEQHPGYVALTELGARIETNEIRVSNEEAREVAFLLAFTESQAERKWRVEQRQQFVTQFGLDPTIAHIEYLGLHDRLPDEE